MITNRDPTIRRLNHDLGMLERPSLLKIFLYAKSLTCLKPFPNTRELLATLYDQIVQDGRIMQSGGSSEARIISFYAQVFMTSDDAKLLSIALEAIANLKIQPPTKNRDIGVEVMVINLAFLLGLGLPFNRLWHLSNVVISEPIQTSRPSVSATGHPGALGKPHESPSLAST
jgi:hypothetical protein